jgi:HAE1 family hydrophobic/amphiphilic exporter-1
LAFVQAICLVQAETLLRKMVFGMLPIALAKGTASEWKNRLAWVIIGGLLSSLILTVYLVPMVYYVADRLKEKFGRKTA